ncbi:hypothetical protein DCC81_07825 [Chitinophaga parva]|uniref:Uncharacterized protein n=1 Tax=Chitinophaga parva TaxID=2169414 RepID=A0A2T7BNV6_9BACT|nr:hypothetical protein [Chitinophaga parva]PUZ29354.1 hypothetical protein DCC81_07825 [Chitinophaga parva]
MKISLFGFCLLSCLMLFAGSAALAQKQGLFIEKKMPNDEGLNPYNYDNKIFVAGKTYVYNYFIIKGPDTLKYAISPQAGGEKNWKYVAKMQKDSNTVAYLGIKTLGKIGPIMMDKPDYDQTEIFLYHYNPNLKPLDTELTGVVENQANVWLHPFRFHALEILQLSPFPYVKLPFKQGQTFYWSLDLGKKWPEFKAFNWKGNLKLNCTYVEQGKETLELPFGKVEVIKVKSVAVTAKGNSSLIAYFSEAYGFVKLVYRNLDGSIIVMSLNQIR